MLYINFTVLYPPYFCQFTSEKKVSNYHSLDLILNELGGRLGVFEGKMFSHCHCLRLHVLTISRNLRMKYRTLKLWNDVRSDVSHTCTRDYTGSASQTFFLLHVHDCFKVHVAYWFTFIFIVTFTCISRSNLTKPILSGDWNVCLSLGVKSQFNAEFGKTRIKGRGIQLYIAKYVHNMFS